MVAYMSFTNYIRVATVESAVEETSNIAFGRTSWPVTLKNRDVVVRPTRNHQT